MQVLRSDLADPFALGADERLWLYNGFDCMVTREVADALLPKLDPVTQATYEFSRRLQAPALAMMLRGFRVDKAARQLEVRKLNQRGTKLRSQIDTAAQAVWGKGLNPNSWPQRFGLLYEHMKLPEQFDPKTRKLTTGKAALEVLHFEAPELIGPLLEFANLKDLNRMLRAGVEADGRMYCTFNPAATETGRWSSSRGAFWGGTNLQNVPKGDTGTPSMRHLFVPDEGWLLVSMDLSQSDSRCVAYLAQDENYIAAHEKGDIHLAVASTVYQVPLEKITSKQRKGGKWRQHALNYFPGGAGRCAKMLAARGASTYERELPFVERSFAEFPKVRLWHNKVSAQLRDKGVFTTPFGRRRRFFGRPWAGHTLREAIANGPQSMTTDALNHGLLRIFEGLEARGNLRLLAQVHDELVFQVRERPGLSDDIIRAKHLMEQPVKVHGRQMTIPVSVKTGRNWRDMDRWAA